MVFGVVILNYLNYEDTKECVDSLLLQKEADLDIVVVDNHSKNDSYEILKNHYSNEKLKIIKTDMNLGYSQGNNVGIKYLTSIGVNDIVILNSDTVINDTYFFKKLSTIPFNDDEGIVGFDIIGRDSLKQNPIYKKTTNTEIIKDLVLVNLSYWKRKFFGVKNSENVSNSLDNKNISVEIPNFTGKKLYLDSDSFLHGAALLLREPYIQKYKSFYPDTFLYYEENILKIRMNKCDMRMVYIDSLRLYHKEDGSSNLVFTNQSLYYYRFLKKSIFQAFLVSLNLKK